MKYREFIEKNTMSCDASGRGGTLKVDVSELFPDIEDAVMGAYQNYLGGGMLGAIVGATMFDPSELNKKDQAVFEEIKEDIKKYFHEITNHEDDEWEAASYEQNQRRAVSAY